MSASKWAGESRKKAEWVHYIHTQSQMDEDMPLSAGQLICPHTAV